MTIVPAGSGTGITGLEDFSTSDLSLPRLNIDHANGCFKDSLDGRTYETISVVVLGLVKQRVLWHPEMQETAGPPLCKSLNHSEGLPGEDFPWDKSGFAGLPHDGTLPCGACKLKEWGSHPTRSDSTWCAEQYVLPVAMPYEDGYGFAVATFQRSGVKPTKAYLSGFARENIPTFTSYTTISFETNRRGTVTYSVPKFVRGDATPDEDHAEFASQYLMLRQYLQTPRVREETDPSDAYKSDDTAPAAAPAASPAAAAPAAPVTALSTDEEPF